MVAGAELDYNYVPMAKKQVIREASPAQGETLSNVLAAAAEPRKVIQTLLLSGTLLLTGSMAPAFAQLVAGGVELPPNYNTFQPPAVGGTYVDPVFGSTVKRISNALGTPDAASGGDLTWITDEYSTMSPFNSDNSRILLVHQSYFGLYDGTGFYLRDLPLEINSSSEPRWSRADNHTIYYVHGNQFKTYDISSGAMNVVHTFSEYSAISGMGESDISFDGDHFVFAGDRRYVFVYRIGTDTKSSTFDTGGQSFDSLYITPDNNVTITWNQTGAARYTGIELFDSNMSFQRQVARAGGHMDVTLDTNGNEVLVWTNSNDPQPICNNGIVKIRLADGQQTCLASFDWSLAVHISAPDNSGFVYVDTYAPGNPNPPTGWVAYTNELLRIKLDGSQVLRLAHHRSRPFQTNTYNWQPRISSSRDGSLVVYNSDYDLQVIDGYADQYSDVYLIAPTTTTTTTVVRYEQNNPAVQLTGNWYPNSGAFNSGGSAVLAMDQGSQARFTFTGTGVQWIGFRDAWSGIAQVYVDGVLEGLIDTYSAEQQAQAVVYSISGLSNASHSLTIVVTGTRNANSGGAWVWVDAFDVSIPPVTQYKFTSGTNPANGGTITAGGWLDAGSVVTVQATPAAGYKFAYFSGDLTGATNPQSLTMNGPKNVAANFQALAPVLTAAVAAKANGTIAGQRVWTIRLSDTGAGPALGAQMTGVTLTQVSGTACSPAASAVTTFPVAVGDIAVGANATGAVTLGFGGCPDSTARFTAKVNFSANSGAYTGSTTINNQPK